MIYRTLIVKAVSPCWLNFWDVGVAWEIDENIREDYRKVGTFKRGNFRIMVIVHKDVEDRFNSTYGGLRVARDYMEWIEVNRDSKK